MRTNPYELALAGLGIVGVLAGIGLLAKGGAIFGAVLFIAGAIAVVGWLILAGLGWHAINRTTWTRKS